jgi:hypothetical protein
MFYGLLLNTQNGIEFFEEIFHLGRVGKRGNFQFPAFILISNI